jgi:hypothetical protein
VEDVQRALTEYMTMAQVRATTPEMPIHQETFCLQTFCLQTFC